LQSNLAAFLRQFSALSFMMKISALTIVVALTMQSPVALALGLSADLLGCPRDCGLWSASMHTGTPGTSDCRETCALFPLLRPNWDCGGCNVDKPNPPPEKNEPFDVRLAAPGVPLADHDMIMAAVRRWTNVITNGLVNVSTTGLPPITPQCPYPLVVDDVFICIVYQDIDGPSGTLGRASVDSYRTDNGLPVGGSFIVDRADLPMLKADGSYANVLAHEIGHLLGKYKRLECYT
jgi:hypothetical protein